MAIGNPLSLTSTVTAGIVSAIGRGGLGLIKDSYGVESFIQTDAAINPGNSGGALVDLSGAVIGVNSAIASSNGGTYIGYGFAIPINLAKSVAKDLIANGKVSRGYIGIKISEVDDAIAKSIGLNKPHGIMVQDVLADGAAKNAGIKPGDVILKIDGKDVDQPNELQSYIASKSAGTSVKLTLFRDGKEIDKSVTLKARDEESTAKPISDNNSSENENESKTSTIDLSSIGLSVQNLTTKQKDELNIDHGILIAKVKPFSSAEDQKLYQGLVITEADKKKISDVNEFKDLVKEKQGSALLLKVEDGKGNSRFVGIEIPE